MVARRLAVSASDTALAIFLSESEDLASPKSMASARSF